MKTHDRDYQTLLLKISKDLKIGGTSLEEKIIAYCVDQVDVMSRKTGAIPKTLDQLLVIVAGQLDLGIREIHSLSDFELLKQECPPSREPVIATIPSLLDSDTSAVVLHRPNRQIWEKRYLAVINCLDHHLYRRYFSKWHEIVHLLLEGKQMTFAFRRTRASERQQPLETLVDRVAGHLAFYAPIFKPVLENETRADGRLTFDGMERIRTKLMPEASWQSTRMACVNQSSQPVMYASFAIGLKKQEERRLREPDLFPETTIQPEAKLRLKECFVSPAAKRIHLEMFPNMSVSGSKLIARIYSTGGNSFDTEEFSSWHDGLPKVNIHVEAMKQGTEVHCLVQQER